MRSSSITRACIRSATTAAWIRSPAYLGKMTPRETSPTLCPARPTRCRPLATDGGDSTWMTRSTAPMSMPSSRLEVATTAGSRPALSASSISDRSARETDPWCARAMTTVPSRPPPSLGPARWPSARSRPPPPGPGHVPGPACPVRAEPAAARRRPPSPPAALQARSVASSLSRPQSRSASRRELANTIVDRCAWIRSSTRSSTCGQIDRRRAGSSSPSARLRTVKSLRSSTGTITSSSICLELAGCTTVTGRAPPRKRATSSAGRTVADSPTRWPAPPAPAARRAAQATAPGARPAWCPPPRAPRPR